MRQRQRAAGMLDLEQAAVVNIESPEQTFLSEGEPITQRFESQLVEGPALFKIADFDGYVIDQRASPNKSSGSRLAKPQDSRNGHSDTKSLPKVATMIKDQNKSAARLSKGDGAGEGNRTLVFSLGSCCSTIKLHPPDTLEMSNS